MVAQLSCNGGSTLLSVRRVAPFYHFFFYTLPVDRLLQLVQLSHYIKQVNPPKFYLQHLVWGSYLSSLQNVQNVKHGSTLPDYPYNAAESSVWYLKRETCHWKEDPTNLSAYFSWIFLKVWLCNWSMIHVDNPISNNFFFSISLFYIIF